MHRGLGAAAIVLTGVALTVAATTAGPTQSPRPGYVRVQGHELVAPDGTPLRLKGIGLGNWLLPEGYMFRFKKGAQSPRQIQELISELVGPDESRAFWTAFRDAWITRDDIRFLKKAGFDHVRVPFNYRLLTPEDQPGVWLPEGFALLDRVVGWCREEGLWVVLDMHGAPGGQTGRNIDDGWGHPWLYESAESQERTVAIWRRLAERYRGETAVLGYDLLNEPLPNGYEALNPRVEPLYCRLVAAIRGGPAPRDLPGRRSVEYELLRLRAPLRAEPGLHLPQVLERDDRRIDPALPRLPPAP
jgi:hypothetical protein